MNAMQFEPHNGTRKLITPNGLKKTFVPLNYYHRRQIFEAARFAKDTVNGDIPKDKRSFGENSYTRTEMVRYLDTLSGKLGEYTDQSFFNDNGLRCPNPDMEVRSGHENLDFIVERTFLISSKSAKPFSNILMLECHRYDSDAGYKVTPKSKPIIFDYTLFNRVGFEDEGRFVGIRETDVVISDPELTAQNLWNKQLCGEVVGALSKKMLLEIINDSEQRFTIEKGSAYVGNSRPMDTSNFCCYANDLIPPRQLIKLMRHKILENVQQIA